MIVLIPWGLTVSVLCAKYLAYANTFSPYNNLVK